MRHDSWWQRMLVPLLAISAALTILAVPCGAVYAVVYFATGGVKSNNQVQIDQLINSVNAMQRSYDAMTARFDALTAQVGSLPKTTDLTALETHMAHVDSDIAALVDRLTNDEIKSAATNEAIRQLQTGTRTPVREPRNP